MNRTEHELDDRPGALPKISVISEGVRFLMSPIDVRGQQLSLRCDDDGGLWIAIKRSKPHDPNCNS